MRSNRNRLTRVDQLLLRNLPALVRLNLGLELANRFRRLCLYHKLVLFKVLRNCECMRQGTVWERSTLNVIFMVAVGCG